MNLWDNKEDGMLSLVGRRNCENFSVKHYKAI